MTRVATARSEAAELALEDDGVDPEALQRQRGRETGEAAADDGHIGTGFAGE